jgi:hypothetical protein
VPGGFFASQRSAALFVLQRFGSSRHISLAAYGSASNPGSAHAAKASVKLGSPQAAAK